MFKIIYSLKSLQLCNILRSGNPLILSDLFLPHINREWRGRQNTSVLRLGIENFMNEDKIDMGC